MLRPLKRLKKRKKRVNAKIRKSTNHKKDPPQLLGSIILLPWGMEIQEGTRKEVLGKSQLRLHTRITTKQAIIQRSAQSL